MISAEILADSKNQFGNRLTTMKITFPRYILAEFNTHRMFSRNSASSRAIPFEKNLESVSKNPFIPIAWMKEHKGMQGSEYFSNTIELDIRNGFDYSINYVKAFIDSWNQAKTFAINSAKEMSGNGLTKQLCNRLLEPFMWHTCIVSATEWENFFYLRCPQYRDENGNLHRSKKDYLKPQTDSTWSIIDWLKINKGQADIHMMALAEIMWDAYNESTPKELKDEEWHIPFGDKIEVEKLKSLIGYEMDGSEESDEEFQNQVALAKIKIAVVRCARVSYTTLDSVDKPIDYGADLKLYEKLVTSGHWSCFEHVAKAMDAGEFDSSFHKGFEGDGPDFYTNGWSGNFRGFIQYRKTFQGENKVLTN